MKLRDETVRAGRAASGFLRNVVRRRWLGTALPVWYDPRYRPPIPSLEARTGAEPRRADSVAWYLVESGTIAPSALRRPPRATYAEMAAVHGADYLESLTMPETLGRVFSIEADEVPVDELFATVRLATGGTLAAAKESLARRGPALNLLGGFHHAHRDRGGGNSPINDIAVAIAVLRQSGYRGRVAVIDLDAHPPDGTADCLGDDLSVWIGSLSGVSWGELPPRVDETVLPAGCGDIVYLEALEALLHRVPRDVEMGFVIAGGDVLAGDRLGLLGLSLTGTRVRDLLVRERLAGLASVWVPGGGYHDDAWRVLAGTGLALSLNTTRAIASRFDPMRAQFGRIRKSIADADLSGEDPEARFTIDAADIEEALGIRRRSRERLLGFYTAEGIEYALFRYGVLTQLERLGYQHFRVAIDSADTGDRLRLFARISGSPAPEQLLVEMVVERRTIADRPMLFVNWLTLRHPRAHFSEKRPQLPGQSLPGLGMSREAGELLAQMARRLSLAAVAFRPAWFHVAYVASKGRFEFADDARQGRFEALLRDLEHAIPLLELTTAIAEGRVRMNGEVYRWEPEDMVFRVNEATLERSAVAIERERVHFSVVPRGSALSRPGPLV